MYLAGLQYATLLFFLTIAVRDSLFVLSCVVTVFSALFWLEIVSRTVALALLRDTWAENVRLKEDIEKSDSAIEKLFASMIHEFRGPINSMI
jgi:hypothetical protein